MIRHLPVLFFLFAVQAAAAQTPAAAPAPPPAPQYPIIQIGMTSFLQYAAEFEHRDDYTAFDVTRAYFNVNAQISPRVRFRFTPDIRRITDSSLAGSLTLRV